MGKMTPLEFWRNVRFAEKRDGDPRAGIIILYPAFDALYDYAASEHERAERLEAECNHENRRSLIRDRDEARQVARLLLVVVQDYWRIFGSQGLSSYRAMPAWLRRLAEG